MMPRCGYYRNHRAIAARREELRQHYIAKGAMDGTNKMADLLHRKLRRYR